MIEHLRVERDESITFRDSCHRVMELSVADTTDYIVRMYQLNKWLGREVFERLTRFEQSILYCECDSYD